MASRDVPWVGPAIPYLDYRFYHRRRRIASGSIMLPVIAVELYDLREVGLPREYVLNPALVELVSGSIATNTHASPISLESASSTLRCFLLTKVQISSD